MTHDPMVERELAAVEPSAERPAGREATTNETCVHCGSEQLELRFPRAARPIRIEAPHEAYRITWSRRDWIGEIRACRRCGLQALPGWLRRAAARRYEDVFDPTYLSQEADRIANARRLLRSLPERGSLLEIGCSCGFLLCAAREMGFEPEGIEPSGWAAAIARERFGLRVSEGFFPEVRGLRDSYDVVVLADVIEHVADPRSVLAEAFERLRPGGYLLVLTPDAGSVTARMAGSWWWALLDDHVVYFTRRTLRAMLEGVGFERPRTRAFGRSFPLRHWASKLSQYAPGVQRLAVAALRGLRVSELHLPLNLGDQMQCIARRPAATSLR